jgi:hypothetical protein
MPVFKFCCRCLELLGTMCTDVFGATAPVVVPNRVGRLLLIMSKAAARKIDFYFFVFHHHQQKMPLSQSVVVRRR